MDFLAVGFGRQSRRLACAGNVPGSEFAIEQTQSKEYERDHPPNFHVAIKKAAELNYHTVSRRR